LFLCHAAGGGKVVSWGRGKSGQLGHGDCESIMQPKLVGSLENISISSMAAGWSHSAFVSGHDSKHYFGYIQKYNFIEGL